VQHARCGAVSEGLLRDQFLRKVIVELGDAHFLIISPE
jgi:hypothetical protein